MFLNIANSFVRKKVYLLFYLLTRIGLLDTNILGNNIYIYYMLNIRNASTSSIVFPSCNICEKGSQ